MASGPHPHKVASHMPHDIVSYGSILHYVTECTVCHQLVATIHTFFFSLFIQALYIEKTVYELRMIVYY